MHGKTGKCPFIDRMKPLDAIQRFMRPSMRPHGWPHAIQRFMRASMRPHGRPHGWPTSFKAFTPSSSFSSSLLPSSSSPFPSISPPFIFIFRALNCSSHPNKQIFEMICRIHQHLSRIFTPSSPRYLSLNSSFENDYFHFLSPSFQVE